ncbi:MAG: sodium:calcium antiporter, partial [Flavobacteriales bacterium]|nr:sodium:calcium antiporter [Flavobacteriales bacterium]
ALGMSQTAIGLTVVALGTSLPEIVTSIIAARKISGEMAVGNVLGSNIFNGLFILGISASIMPVSVGETFSQLDLYITMVGSVLLMICIGLWKKISRIWGAIFVLLYALYVMYALGIIKL